MVVAVLGSNGIALLHGNCAAAPHTQTNKLFIKHISLFGSNCWIHNLISKDHRFLRVVLRHVCGNRFLKSCEERRGQHLLNAFLRLCCEVFVAIDFGNPVGSGVANTFGMHFPVCVAKYLLQSFSEILWERRGQHLRNLFPRLCCE